MGEGQRILLAVRVGDASAAPGRTGAWLASRLGADITVLYVATELRTAGEIAVTTGIELERLREQMLEEARERVEAWGRASLDGSPFEARVEEGSVGERVGEVAAEIDARLVVAGSEGRGRIRGMILGDTTSSILRHSPCPVVVVPPGADEG